MTTRVETDITVQRFRYADDTGRRLIFPRAEIQKVDGRSGGVSYGVEDGIFDGLEGRLDTVRWTSEAASLGSAWIRDDSGRFEIAVDRIELSNGIMLTHAERGMELVSPHVSLSEMRLTVKGPFGRGNVAPAPASPPGAPATLRQDGLRFLDSLSGRINLTVKVVLDLPVIKRRTLDQRLEVPITEGSLDFRALEESLDWLEGAFLDITHDKDKLALKWKVPIFGGGRDLIAWRLDEQAQTMATFGRVPVRSLADVRRKARPDDKVDDGEDDTKNKTLQSLTIEAIDVVMSLLAPRSLEVGGGVIMFGGEGEPVMVDLKVTGNISTEGPGALSGAIGSVDTTIKDLRMGPVLLTADRLHFDGLDQLEVTFDGFSPSKVTMVVHRVTATNLSLRLGGTR